MRRLHKYKFNIKNRRKLKTRLNNDSRYFINVLFMSLIKRGLKHKVFSILCRVIYNIKLNRYYNKKNYLSTLGIFKIVFFRLNSKIFLKSQHLGKTKYILPLVSTHNSIALAVKWFFNAMNARSERTLYLRLYNELLSVLNNMPSPAINEKKKYYKLAFDSKNNFKILRILR